MKKFGKILWGIILIAAGVLFALNALDITDIDLFFDGWWTLFIIVPSVIGIFTEKDKTGSFIGLAIGVFFLLSAQEVISFELTAKLIIPIIIIIVGIKLIFGSLFDKKTNELANKFKDNKSSKSGVAAFSGQKLDYSGEKFDGVKLDAIFGGKECDLRQATITEDCLINASAIFGGIDIFVPDGVNVKINSTSIFGGISDKKKGNSNANNITVFVNGTCLFGGIDIK